MALGLGRRQYIILDKDEFVDGTRLRVNFSVRKEVFPFVLSFLLLSPSFIFF